MARIRLDRAALNRTFRATSRREGDIASRQVLNRARVLTPVRTGRLRASLRVERRSTFGLRLRWTIGSDVEYADMVHDGTRPHVIRPRTKQALRFRMGGRTVIVAKVNHPGTRARPFLDRALAEVARARDYTIRRG